MAKKPDHTQERVIENRKARFDYHIDETLEVGMVLRGSEIKSVRNGEVSLGEGYVLAEGLGEKPVSLLLLNVNIGEYGPSGALGHKPKRPRPLLAHKREILKLAKAAQAKGMTIVPLKLYFKNGYAKLLIGVARGKQAHDKRDTIAKRESKRD